MAFETLDFPAGPFPASGVYDSDADGTIETISGSGVSINVIDIDNTANTTAGTVWVKLYNLASGATVGSTAPDVTIPCSNGGRLTFTSLDGLAFHTGLMMACVTNGGGTAGTTSPTNAVKIRVLYT